MDVVYLNYASTSAVKSPAVVAAAAEYLQGNCHISAGRNADGLEDTAQALKARLALGKLFGVKNPSVIVFTSGVTASLNMLLNGIVKKGDHVISTSVEHNAVARPLALLEKNGVIEVTWLQCAPDGTLSPEAVAGAVRRNSRLMVMTHASNVLGTILSYPECFAEAKKYGLVTVLDTAQTVGGIELKLDSLTDALAFTGHKGLGGFAGIGGFVLNKDIADSIEPWFVGGTGSASDSLEQPLFLPDKFEPGTPNTLGIISLGAAAKELEETGVASIRRHEMAMTERFLAGARELPVTVHGTGDAKKCMPVVSVSVPDADMGEVAKRLFHEHGVVVRCGLHCSPLAHKTAGTFPAGTIRFSFGRDTTPEHVDAGLKALEAVIS